MRDLLRVLAIAATLGALAADFALLDRPLVRNGWLTLAFFAVPLGLLLASRGEKGSRKLEIAAWSVLVLGSGAWIAARLLVGKVDGIPHVAVGGKAPDFTLEDADGARRSLSDYLGGDRRVLLVFFRGSG